MATRKESSPITTAVYIWAVTSFIGLIVGGFWNGITGGGLIRAMGGLTDKEAVAAGAIPVGAVLIVDSSKGCPKDWENIGDDSYFAGRVIVPTGFGRKFRDRGGASSVVLNLAQIPMHSHKPVAKEGAVSAPGLSVSIGGFFTPGVQRILVPDDTADSKEKMVAVNSAPPPKPVDLIEPFVALHFCKKV